MEAATRWFLAGAIIAAVTGLTVVHAASWTQAANLAVARTYHQAVRLNDGHVLIAGGYYSGADPAIETEIYDPNNDVWEKAGDLFLAREGFTLTLLKDGTVLAAGGYFAGDLHVALRDCERFDPSTRQWNRTGALLTARANFATALLSDGRVIAMGGGTENGYVPTSSAEVYDPVTGTWTATGELHTTFYGNAAAVLLGGDVLVVGSYPVPYRVSELYRPDSGEWSYAGSLSTMHSLGLSMTVLEDGRALVVGGIGLSTPPAQNASELYDPATATWARTATTLSVPRAFHTAVRLLDGTVLVAGGDDGNTFDRVYHATVDLFQPLQEAWLPAPSMATPRSFHTATLLLDGRVLIAGGSTNYPNPTTSACEVYAP